MNQIVEINKKARIRQEASEWLVRLEDGLDSEQETELINWLKLDQEHQNQLLDLASVWDDLGVLTELAPLFDNLPLNKLKPKDQARSQPMYAWGLGIIAALCVAIVSVFSYQNVNTPVATPELTQTDRTLQQLYATPIGENSRITLADGSIVSLYPDSEIVVTFSSGRRSVVLANGEAHFDVEPDSARPLSVTVSGRVITAVGTAFSVRKDSQEIEVAVDEGTVAVRDHTNKASPATLTPEPDDQDVSLNAGDVLKIIENKQNITKFDETEMENRLAWTKGMIVIDNQSLSFVISEFERYNHKKFLLADKAMANIKVAGYFSLGDIDALLVALENNFGIRSEHYQNDNTFVLSQL